MNRLLIEQKNGATEIALLSDRALMDYALCRAEAVAAEQIYLGRVERIQKGMSAAFVALSGDTKGFLPLNETKAPLKGGDTLLVQVKKPPVQEKLAYLTADIALAGAYFVLLPCGKRHMVSARVEEEPARAALLALAGELAPEGMGLVMRRRALSVSREMLEGELAALLDQWRHITEKAQQKKAPCLIDPGPSPLKRALRDFAPIDFVLADSDAALDDCPAASVSPNPFALYDVRGQLKKACARHIWLKSGGFLIVDVCEALTVIDVNTGKFAGKRSGAEDTFLALNLEAAAEIARLMRVRGMGGIVLVDFIDMKDEAHRQRVLEAMERALKDDPVKCVVHGFTSLGLMEITRKKAERPLNNFGSETPCPHCGGTGVLKEDV